MENEERANCHQGKTPGVSKKKAKTQKRRREKEDPPKKKKKTHVNWRSLLLIITGRVSY